MECPNRPNDDDYRVLETDSDSGDFNDDDVLDEDYKPVHDESSSDDCDDGDFTSDDDRPNVEEDDCTNTCRSWDELSEVFPVYKTSVLSNRNRPTADVNNECNSVTNNCDTSANLNCRLYMQQPLDGADKKMLKNHSCLYCGKHLSKMARHLQQVHTTCQ